MQKYLTLTGHGFEMTGWCMGEEFYQSLPDDVRDVMNQTLAELTLRHRADFAKKNEEWLEFFGTAGKGNMQVNTLPMEELMRIRKVVEPMLQISRDLAGAEYTDKMYSIIALIVGMFMEPTSANLVFSPLLLSIVQPLGVNPVHFGILVTLNLAMGFVVARSAF